MLQCKGCLLITKGKNMEINVENDIFNTCFENWFDDDGASSESKSDNNSHDVEIPDNNTIQEFSNLVEQFNAKVNDLKKSIMNLLNNIKSY